MITVGHRGAAGLEPENTLLGFRKAIEIGVDFIELDVHLSKDGEIIVMHDNTVDRTTDGTGKVGEMTLEELKKLDAGKGEKIPTLQEAIDVAKDKVGIIIELKGENTEEPVFNAIKKNNLEKARCVSFHHDRVKKVKGLNNSIYTGVLLVGAPVNPVSVADDAGADELTVNFKFIEKEFVEKCHAGNKQVFVWNCDTEEDIRRMIDLGVDGIGSNLPDLLVKVVKND
ncbi:MAG: glycerophosphodiester phosphodiesterase [bacterium]|nr:glycerophosphodiester phosphodiesterase [bacterium]